MGRLVGVFEFSVPTAELMIKKIPPILSVARFSWLHDPDFAQPDSVNESRLAHSSPAPRISELKTLLKYFLENIIRAVNASAGVVRILSPDGCTLQIIGSAGLSTELREKAENLETLNCEISHSARLAREVYVSDISQCILREDCLHVSCHFSSLIGAPLEPVHAHGKRLGVLTVFFDESREVTIQYMDMIASFAKMMSAAIEHAQSNREDRRVELLSERNAIANDIHDSLAQTLTYARMRASLLLEATRRDNKLLAIDYADDLDDALSMAQKSVRELVTDFRCKMNRGGLTVALKELVDEFGRRNNITLEYNNRLIALELPLEFEIQTYFIIHEALNNIARHSGATHARLFVDSDFGYYIFTIEDNGRGASTFSAIEGHYGLMIMRERAQKIGGTIKFDSHAGQGTHVQLFFPEPTPDWRATQ